MLRALVRNPTRVGIFLLLGILLTVAFLYRMFIDLKPNKKVQTDVSQISKLTQNTSYVFPWEKCEINMSASKVRNFGSLPLHIRDFLCWKHCRHFPMLLDLPHKCGGAARSSEVFLLMAIKSSPQNYDRRAILRQTWAKERVEDGVSIKLVFLAGVTRSGFEMQRLNKLLEVEHDEYKDILQWDFRDTFFNLTLKQTLFLEWMDRNCPNARFVFSGDDDVFANTDKMITYLQNLKDNDGSKHLFAGSLRINTRPIRDEDSKYFVPVQVQESNLYPPYCDGGGIILSGHTALVIHNMSKSIPLVPIDDVYMGMCLLKAGLQPERHMGVKTGGMEISFRGVDSLDPCFYKEILVAHRFLSAELYLMWHRINDPNLKCFGRAKV